MTEMSEKRSNETLEQKRDRVLRKIEENNSRGLYTLWDYEEQKASVHGEYRLVAGIYGE